MDGSLGDCTCRIRDTAGTLSVQRSGPPCPWCAILGRTLHTQSTHFEAEREILPYLYGFHPPFVAPYLRTTHPEKPLVYRCPRQQTRGTGRCRLALRSVETLGRAHLEDQAQYFLQFSDLNPSPIIQEDGSVMMIFKGRHYTNGYLHSAMSLGMAYCSYP